MIELECERCGERLAVRSARTEAWHGSCSKRAAGKGTVIPRYVPLKNAQPSDP